MVGTLKLLVDLWFDLALMDYCKNYFLELNTKIEKIVVNCCKMGPLIAVGA